MTTFCYDNRHASRLYRLSVLAGPLHTAPVSAIVACPMCQTLTDLPAMHIQVAPSAEGARNYSQCDSMLIGDGAAANTYPYIQVHIISPPQPCQLCVAALHIACCRLSATR